MTIFPTPRDTDEPLLRRRLHRNLAVIFLMYAVLNFLVFPKLYFHYQLNWIDPLLRVPQACTVWECNYFSVVTSTTLGYGDIHPDTLALQIIVIAQLLISFFVLILWLGYTFAFASTAQTSPSSE